MSKLHVRFLLALLHSTEITLMLEMVLKCFSVPVLLMAGNTVPHLATFFGRLYPLPLSHTNAWHRQDSVFIQVSGIYVFLLVFFISMDICCRIFKLLANDLTHYLQAVLNTHCLYAYH